VINGSNRLTIEGYRPEWLGSESYFMEGEAELPRRVDLALNMCLAVERVDLALTFSKCAVYLHLVLAATSGLCVLPRLEFHWSAVLLF